MNKRPHTRVLIVEDEPLIALTLEELLVKSEFEVVGIAGRLESALELIDRAGFDVAVLDANLAGVSASPAAAALTASGVPFVVTSGYSTNQLTGDFFGAHFMRKPFRPDQLIHSLNKVLMIQQVSPRPNVAIS